METRYFNPKEFIHYALRGEIATDLSEGATLGRCSIADLIELCELQKKNNLNVSQSELLKKLEPFVEHFMLNGTVFVADLDQETLSNILFVERNPSELWAAVATMEIPPLHSLRRLTLKNTEWDFWGENVYIEMEEFFSEQLTDG